MGHLIAWSESAAASTLTDLDPVTDQIVLITNSHFLMKDDWWVQWMAVMATDIQRARLNAPSFRQITTPWIRPLQAALVGGSLPGVADYRRNPLKLPRLEEVALEAFQDNVGAQRITALAYLTRQANLPVVPAGDMYTMRGTSTTAVTANAWTNITVTWQDTLPAGVYAAVGLEHQSANGQASRLIFEGQIDRPGTLSFLDMSNINSPIMTKGALGELGRFDSVAMPQVQVLANAADAAHEVYLDLVRIRPGGTL